jgi:hypothetical protein
MKSFTPLNSGKLIRLATTGETGVRRRFSGLGTLLAMLASVTAFATSGCSKSEPKVSDNRREEAVGQTNQELTDADVSHVTGSVWYVNNSPYIMKGVDWDPSETCEYYTQYNWQRAATDAVLMAANGFNTVRTYGFTSAKTGLPESGYITTSQLDSFLSNGIHVVITVHSAPGDSTWTGAGTDANGHVVPATGDFTQAAKDRITMLAAHQAVIALGVGNEIDWNYFYTKDPGGAWTNGWTEAQVIQHANYVVNKVKALTGKPVTVSWGNTTNISQVGGLNADIISYQLYDSLSVDDVFNKHNTYSSKPFWMSEFGADAWNMNLNGPGQGGLDETSQATADTNLFKQILDNATTGANGPAGGARMTGATIFSWSDGWWKAGNPCTHEIGGVAPGVGPYPDLTFNEEYWGLCTSDTATRVCRKAAGALKTLFAQYPNSLGDGGGGGGGGPTPRSIASNLEAETNDGASGVQYETTSDTGGGQDAGWIGNGSYIEWFINVPTTGAYTVTSRSASTAAASYTLSVDGAQVETNNIASTGGWQTWQSFTTPNQFTMSQGTHRLRITFTSANQNLNYITVNAFTGGGGGGGSNIIEAESFNSSSGNLQTEGCSEGGLDLNDVGDGEWVEYNNVNLQGVTSFDARVASAGHSGTIEFHSGSQTGTLLATCNAPVTGGWQTWQTVSCSTGSALSGTANLYLVFHGASTGNGLPNVNYFKPVVGGSSGGGGGTGTQPTRLRITNQCTQPIWIAHQEGTGGPLTEPLVIKIAQNTSFDYNIPTGGLQAARFMPRTGCDSTGNNCASGQSIAPCPSGGCQPPIETKFEATFGPSTPTTACPGAPANSTGSCIDWFNASFVDGFTLPVKIIPKLKQAWSDCVTIDASKLDLGQCPSSDNLGPGYTNEDLRLKDSSGNTVGCLSPCKKMDYPGYGHGIADSQEPATHMCCPTPYPNNTPLACTWANGCATSAMCNDMSDPNTVVHTKYVNNLHASVPGIYTFPYDDAQSLRTCMPDTQYEVIYCPGGSSGGGGGGSATCSDGIQNQGETGIDCGGPCAACATCTDGIQNHGETGVDCGGPCPNSCGTGGGGTTIAASTYNAGGGVQLETCSEGGQDITGAGGGGLGEGAWMAYNNVNMTGVTTFSMRVAGNLYASTIEFRTGNQNGTLIATCNAPVTNGWQTWTTISCSVTATSGTVNLYLVSHKNPQPYNAPNGNGLASVEWIKLGSTSCTPTTCTALGATCGTPPDGCGGTLSCGTCGSGQTCGTTFTCQTTCVPKTCTTTPKQCGTITNGDGCGHDLVCGNTCQSPQTCGGGNVANVCGVCTPTSCSAQGKNCGSIPDGCGNTLNCGVCTSPQTCNGGGTANVCGCTPKTCAQLGKNCGTVADGCGGNLSCGTCPSGQTCQTSGASANVCAVNSGTACWSAYNQGSCQTYTTGTKVSRNGHNYTCANANCANCWYTDGSCQPGAPASPACPWGNSLWTDNGACQ